MIRTCAFNAFCTAVLLFLSVLCYGQQSTLKKIAALHEQDRYTEAVTLFTTLDTARFNRHEKTVFSYEKARQLLNTQDAIIAAYTLLLDAKRLVHKDSLKLRFEINDELIYAYNSAIQNNIPPDRLIEENCAIAQKTQTPIHLINCYHYNLKNSSIENLRESLSLLHKSLSVARKNNLTITEKIISNNIGVYHNLAKQTDSAILYFRAVLPFYEKQRASDEINKVYNNLGRSYFLQKDFSNSIYYYRKSLTISNDINDVSGRHLTQKNLAEAYFLSGDFENSASYYDAYTKLVDSVNAVKNMRALEELEIKYQTTEKEKKNAQLEVTNQQKQKTIFGLTAAALLLLITGAFIYKNQRKKQRITLQEKELQKERADNLLKNQELATIDAMITGQENERKKIAEELHDNLGSTLTTVRLYFDKLKHSSKEEEEKSIMDKTEKLLEEAYEKVRSMSHTRHYGVLASKGLIPTLESLAKKITDSGQVQVSIIHHGLDQKLEAGVELTLFRIIQELLSNVMKHAQAQHATVSLTAYTDFINVIVEDDGVGFHTKNIAKSNGMGLNSIETRVEKLNGTFEADSTPGYGSTINIDLPF